MRPGIDREHSRVTDRVYVPGIVLDLNILYSKTADTIATRVGRRGIIVPMAAFSDTLTRVESRLGSREKRLADLLAKIRLLTITRGVPTKIPDWQGADEKEVDSLHFLSQDPQVVSEAVLARVDAYVAFMKEQAVTLESAQRESASTAAEISDHERRWLHRWANEGRDVSNGGLASMIADWLRRADVCRDEAPHMRAISFVGCLDFIRKLGLRDPNVPAPEDLVSNFYDWLYVIWALRFDAYLWTDDDRLRRLCSLAKRVWNIAGLGYP